MIAPRPARFAGLPLTRPLVMGIVNVTPDSFSDGGDLFDPDNAIRRGQEMLAAGADILDIGGESTRPGAAPVTVAEEIRRVVPVIKALAKQGAVISIDSRNAATMAAALDAGARIVNDVTALTHDPAALPLVAARKAPVVLMHIQGTPQTMQQAPHYDDVVRDVRDWLADRCAACRAAGVAAGDIAIDPGIGFGKTVAHNVALIRHLEALVALGYPVLLGVSRKSMIGALSRNEAPKQRLPGSLAAALAGVQRGAAILRVHDVAETVQALAVWQAIAAADRPGTDSD